MDYILKTNNLCKKYGDFSIDNINISLPYKTIMGLIGENGAGKTTILRIILGLIKKYNGDVYIFGVENSFQYKKNKEKIGVVFDECKFHDTLTAEDISVILKNVYIKWNANHFLKLVSDFNIPKNKKIKEYSKGMKTKISIASALSHDAQLLIMDEATSGLDPVARIEVMRLLRQYVSEKNCSILFSSHITSDLEQFADIVTLIHNGKCLFSKTVNCLRNEYSLIQCDNEIEQKLKTDPIEKYLFNDDNGKTTLLLHGNIESINSIYPAKQPSIEEIMLHYIKGDQI